MPQNANNGSGGKGKIPKPVKELTQAGGGVLSVLGLATHTAMLVTLLSALWASVGPLFSLVTIGALTIPPHVPPRTPVDWLIVGLGAALAIHITLGIYRTYKAKRRRVQQTEAND